MTIVSHAIAGPPAVSPIWQIDPTELAVESNSYLVDCPPDSFCTEIGRRLLLAQLESSEWVLRRVDKANLERDRSFTRNSTFEFTIRSDAPSFRSSDGKTLLLVPLTVMRRQTLLNLSLRDEADHPISIPGMRVTQQFDQSILLAAAAAFHPRAACDPAVRAFVKSAIAGTLEDVEDAFAAFDEDRLEFPPGLLDDPLFRSVVNRFRYNFSLYLFLDADRPRHRILSMSFDEPTSWTYQHPFLRRTDNRSWTYRAGLPCRRLARLSALLGFAPIRVRFQTPGAEYAASYHFEITAPPGVQITQATLLAGRPNDPRAKVSFDRIVGHSPTVGLHAVEVPNGSLSRVQVDLRAPARGWLTTVLVAAVAVFGVVLSVWCHWLRGDPRWEADQIATVVLVLITTSAAAATLVAQRDSGDIGARFVGGVRAFGTAAIAMPVVVAAILVYSAIDIDPLSRNPKAHSIQGFLTGLVIISALMAILIFIAWFRSAIADRRGAVQPSPWDMTRHLRDETSEKHRQEREERAAIQKRVRQDFHYAVTEFDFDKPAVGVRSAEGWHSHYTWTRERQCAAIASLQTVRVVDLLQGSACATFVKHCTLAAKCPSAEKRLS